MKKYMAAIEALCENGSVSKGNSVFETEGLLDEATLATVKKSFCADINTNHPDRKCVPERAMILSVIPLEA